MADRRRQQEVAALRTAYLLPHLIKCRFCGEQSASTGSLKGYAHQHGPTRHIFMAAKPEESK